MDNLSKMIENRRLELVARLSSLQSRYGDDLLTPYEQWLADDAGCDLIGFMPETINEADLWLVCESLQECAELAYELDQLSRNAAIGRAFKVLANLANAALAG